MSKGEKDQSNRVYLSIVQGSLRQQVQEGNPDAVKRDWETGGEKGTKWEIPYKAWFGKITDITFYEGESSGRKFVNLNLVFDETEDGKTPVISTGLSTRYAQDILKKLPSIDFREEVRIRPFAFTPEGEDKNITGVEITQRDGAGNFTEKISSFFHKKNKEGKWESVNGYPLPEGDTSEYTSDDWQIYYKQCLRFLVQYAKQNICPKFQGPQPIPKSYEEEHANDINPEDVPF